MSKKKGCKPGFVKKQNVCVKGDFIFDEKPIIRACKRSQKIDADVFGKRFIIYADKYRTRKSIIEKYNVYDKNRDANYKVEYDRADKQWTVWPK